MAISPVPSLSNYLIDCLPIELKSSFDFILNDSFNQSLINTSSNLFFSPFVLKSPSSSSTDDSYIKEVRIRIRPDNGCWNLLSSDWRAYFDQVKLENRDEILKDLATLTIHPDFPPSLKNYLTKCRSLSLDRTCSNTPLLSYPPPPPSLALEKLSSTSSPIPLPRANQTWLSLPPTVRGKILKNERELSPKKGHEITRFVELLSLIEGGLNPTHCIDVGAGCGHLSRALANELNLQILALDWSEEATIRAAKLNAIHLLNPPPACPLPAATSSSPPRVQGSLTHRTSVLDTEGLIEVMKTWPEQEVSNEAMLIALHACGDLTIAALKAFVSLERESKGKSRRQAILVGCCYNLMTPSEFPISSHFLSLLPPSSTSPVFDLTHLRATPQSSLTWHLSPQHLASHLNGIQSLVHRARFGAEIEGLRTLVPAQGIGEGLEKIDWPVPSEVKVGRIGVSENYQIYRPKALKKLKATGVSFEVLSLSPHILFGISSTEEEREEEWEEAKWKLKVWWTLKALLDPIVESLLVIDRFCFVVEGMERSWVGEKEGEEGGGVERKVELFSLFDQEIGSLRNLAIVVK